MSVLRNKVDTHFAEMLVNIAPAEPMMKPGNTNDQYLSGPLAKANNTSAVIIISAPQNISHLALMPLSAFNLLAKLKIKAVMPIGSLEECWRHQITILV